MSVVDVVCREVEEHLCESLRSISRLVCLSWWFHFTHDGVQSQLQAENERAWKRSKTPHPYRLGRLYVGMLSDDFGLTPPQATEVRVYFECYIRIHYLNAAAQIVNEGIFLAKRLAIPCMVFLAACFSCFSEACSVSDQSSFDKWMVVASLAGIFASVFAASLSIALAQSLRCWWYSREVCAQMYLFLKQGSSSSRKRILDLLEENLGSDEWLKRINGYPE